MLQLGEVLKHKGVKAFAQTNRNKVGDLGLDGRIYMVDRAELKQKQDETLFGEKQPYIPIQVKNKDKAGRPDIDSFAHALHRDNRNAGLFIAWDFTRDADKEIERLHGGRGRPCPRILSAKARWVAQMQGDGGHGGPFHR